MASLNDVRVAGWIGPSDDTDTYYCTDPFYGIDGLRSVPDKATRNAITRERRRQGMFVAVQSDFGLGINTVWQLKPAPWNLDDSDWTQFGGGGGSLVSVNTGPGLTGGPITTSGTISVATGGITPTFLAVGAAATNVGTLGGDLTGTLPNPTVVSLSGVPFGTMAIQNANAVNISGGAITGIPTPVGGSDVANKNYVDAVTTQLSPRNTCVSATVSNLTATYNNGASGVGATLTNSGTLAAFAVDGVTANTGDRVLVKNQTSLPQNGIYTVTNTGSGSVAWILTRATDYNSPSNVSAGTYTVISSGTSNSGTIWIEIYPGPFVIGTSNIGYTMLNIMVQNTIFSGDIAGSGTGNIAVTVMGIRGNPLGSTTPAAGNLLIATGAQWVSTALSGDATLTSAGVIKVTKTNNVLFATSATTDTTNATNITSGTLSSARLPNPATNALGGIQAVSSVTNQWIDSISIAGVPHLSQPGFANLSGTITVAQIPNAVITPAKLQNLSASVLWGNPTGLPASPSEITLGTGLSFSGTQLIAATGGLTLIGDVTGTGTGTIPTTVTSINGQLLGSTTPTTGNLLIASSNKWTSVAMSGDATILGTGVITIASGAVTPAKLALGAAATNVGTLGGDLTGTLPNPTIANSAITSVKIAAGAASSNVGTLGGDLTGTLPNPTIALLAVTNAKMATGAASSNVGTLGGDLTGTLPSPTVANSAITTAKINSSAVTYSKLQNETAATLLGNPTGLAAAPSEITLGSGLTFSGTTLVALASGVTSITTGAGLTSSPPTITSTGTISLATIGTGYILANISGTLAVPSPTTLTSILDNSIGTLPASLLYRGTSSWGYITLSSGQIIVGSGIGSGLSAVNMSGDATLSNTGSLTISAHAVTYAKIQNETASTLLGNPTTFSVSPSEVTLGTGLSFSGSTLNVSGFWGEKSWVLGSGAPVTTGTDKTAWAVIGQSRTLNRIYLCAKTPPSGSSLVIDIQYSTDNGTTFTSLWYLSPGNRPTLTSGTKVASFTAFDVTTLAAGTLLRIDVASIGSPAQDITVQLQYL
jgi:hypothetical protein